jgi:hypothetical protein
MFLIDLATAGNLPPFIAAILTVVAAAVVLLIAIVQRVLPYVSDPANKRLVRILKAKQLAVAAIEKKPRKRRAVKPKSKTSSKESK